MREGFALLGNVSLGVVGGCAYGRRARPAILLGEEEAVPGSSHGGTARRRLPDGRGGWYFKATVGTDPSTGKRVQVTKRGFRSATEAGKPLRELLGQPQQSTRRPASGMTVSELLDLYLDGLDADDRLSQKTGFDYRNSADVYIRPALGDRRVRDVSPEMLPVRQRKLTKRGASKSGKALSANTIRLARAPLAGGFKLALTAGVVATNPMSARPDPSPNARSLATGHRSRRELLTLIDGDRTFPAWAFLLGSGMRTGEMVALRWPSVDLKGRRVRVVATSSRRPATTCSVDAQEPDARGGRAARRPDGRGLRCPRRAARRRAQRRQNRQGSLACRGVVAWLRSLRPDPVLVAVPESGTPPPLVAGGG